MNEATSEGNDNYDDNDEGEDDEAIIFEDGDGEVRNLKELAPASLGRATAKKRNTLSIWISIHILRSLLTLVNIPVVQFQSITQQTRISHPQRANEW